MMTLNKKQLEVLCTQITDRIGLWNLGQHVAALFQDNDHDEIIRWAVLNDEDNTIVDRFVGETALEDLFTKYDIKYENNSST